MNSRKIINLLFLIVLYVILLQKNFLLADDSGDKMYKGKIFANENQYEEIFLKIYDKPLFGQPGYLVMAGHTYQLVNVDSAYITEKQIYVDIDLLNNCLRVTKNAEGEWTGKWISKSPNYTYEQDLTISETSSIPEWAKEFRHRIYKDGIYEAKGTTTRFGHTPYCMVTVKNGRIMDLIYMERDYTNGDVKDEHYGEEYAADLGPLAYAGGQLSVEGSHVYRNRLILSQDLKNIDKVSGATFTLFRFKSVIKKALKDAVLHSDENSGG